MTTFDMARLINQSWNVKHLLEEREHFSGKLMFFQEVNIFQEVPFFRVMFFRKSHCPENHIVQKITLFSENDRK